MFVTNRESRNRSKRSQSRTMENIEKVKFLFVLVKRNILSFSYRLKPNPYGIKALFGIYLGQIDDSNIISGTIHVGDSIRVTNEDPDFWEENSV